MGLKFNTSHYKIPDIRLPLANKSITLKKKSKQGASGNKLIKLNSKSRNTLRQLGFELVKDA